MKYNIRIFYRTGDSFGSRNKEMDLDGFWENTEIIKENLKRIKEHYEWYKNKNSSYSSKKIEKPTWHTNRYDESIKLKTDKGVEYEQSTYWCGYFESLYGAKAIICSEPDMEFYV